MGQFGDLFELHRCSRGSICELATRWLASYTKLIAHFCGINYINCWEDTTVIYINVAGCAHPATVTLVTPTDAILLTPLPIFAKMPDIKVEELCCKL